MTMYYGTTDNVPTYFKYVVPIYQAKSYAERGKPIESALVYQDLIDALDKDAGHNNKVSDVTYGEWLVVRDKALAKYPTDERVELIRNYKVPTDRTAELSPLVRAKPIFPPRFLRGVKSGAVNVEFDVDSEGTPINIVILKSTNISLHTATRETIKKWRYTPNIPASEGRGVKTTIRFSLSGRYGKRFPTPPLIDRTL